MLLNGELIEVACGFCGGGDRDALVTVGNLRVVQCKECKLVYVTPRPTANALRTLYAAYHLRDGGSEHSWASLMRRIFEESADVLKDSRNGNGQGRLLDVGCGFGGFVELMCRRGWKAEGIDPSPNVVAAAAKKGIPVRLGTLEECGALAASFDAITMFYVLEHLADPMRALRKAYDLLAPGGILLVRVPDTTPIVRMLTPFALGASLYDAPYHLYDFSSSVLRKMLEKTGFEEIVTFPGVPTRPHRLGPRIVALLCGTLANTLYALSKRRFLLPGVSKTTIARKPR